MKQKSKIKQLMGTALAAITAFVIAAGINGNITTVKADETSKTIKYNAEGFEVKDIDASDLEVINEYFGTSFTGLNVFTENSSIEVDAERSTLTLDDIKTCGAIGYSLSRDEAGKLVITKANNGSIIGINPPMYYGSFNKGFGYNELFAVNGSSKLGTTRHFQKIAFSKAYGCKDDEGCYIDKSMDLKSTTKVDFTYMNITCVDGAGDGDALLFMPDYMVDKTVLKFADNSEVKPDDNYTVNVDKSMTAEEFNDVLAKNATKDVIIKTDNGVTFTFAKGTMNKVDGVSAYDFTTQIVSDFENADIVKAVVKNDGFVSQIKFNYSGNLPAKAQITIPVGTDYAGQTLQYSLVNDDNTLTLIQNVVVGQNGYVTVSQDHCSTYVLTKASEVKEGESTQAPTENEDVQAPTENEDVQAPQTSDNSAVVMISLLAVVSLMGMVVFGKKRVL